MMRDVAQRDRVKLDQLFLDLVRRIRSGGHEVRMQRFQTGGEGAPVGHRQRPVKLGLRFSTKDSRPSR